MHKSSLLTLSILMAAVGVTAVSVVPTTPLTLGPDLVPVSMPTAGHHCAATQTLDDPLAVLVSSAEVCTYSGEVASIRLTPRPGMASSVRQLRSEPFLTRFFGGYRTQDIGMETTDDDAVVFTDRRIAGVMVAMLTGNESTRSRRVSRSRSRRTDGVVLLDSGEGLTNALGLRAGDTIVEVDGRPVFSERRLENLLDRPGPKSLTLLRDGNRMELHTIL